MIKSKSMLCVALLCCLDAACAIPPSPAQTLSDACLAASKALHVAIVADQQGQLTEAQVQKITIGGTAINAVCSQAMPPTDLAGALAVVSQATADLSALVTK